MAFDFAHSRHDEAPILIPAIGLELFVRLPPQLSGGTLTVIDTVNAPGFGPPLHRHAETEIFRVLSGRYLFETNGKQFHAEAGDVVSVPGGTAHTFVDVTDTSARQTIVIFPGLNAAAFFRQLGEVTKNGVPDPARLNSFGRDWGIEFLGPPLKPVL
jgi:quercetin dioxygenase-like cupin family protein